MLNKFVGFLNYGNIIAIHADWPTYPNGIGWELALLYLGNYAKETYFYEISEIDNCTLLLSQNPLQLTNPYDSKYLHVAIWHCDLKQLSEKGLIEGVSIVNKYEYEYFKFASVKRRMMSTWPKKHMNQFPEDEHGHILTGLNIGDHFIEHKIIKPLPELYDEDELEYKDFVIIPEKFSISEAGWQMIRALSQHINLHSDIKELVDPLIFINRYDTAIREASLLVETSIKLFHKVNLFGVKLIDYHINDLIIHNDNFNSAALKCYRNELRTLFKFIRNDFAHNFHVLHEEQCRMILFRISKVYEELMEVKNVYYKNL